jgi:hypothetical protein
VVRNSNQYCSADGRLENQLIIICVLVPALSTELSRRVKTINRKNVTPAVSLRRC